MILGNDERQLPLFRDLRDVNYSFKKGKIYILYRKECEIQVRYRSCHD